MFAPKLRKPCAVAWSHNARDGLPLGASELRVGVSVRVSFAKHRLVLRSRSPPRVRESPFRLRS
jgi:hypothetical protein